MQAGRAASSRPITGSASATAYSSTRTPPFGRRVLHDPLVQVDVRARIRPVLPQDGDDVVRVRRPVEHPQPFLGAYRVDECVLRRMGGRCPGPAAN